MVKYGNVTVALIGEDGNAFNLIALTARALRRSVNPDAAEAFVNEAMESKSYDALLALIQRTVYVI